MPGRNGLFPTGVNVSGRYRKWPYMDARAAVKVPSRFRILAWVPELAE